MPTGNENIKRSVKFFRENKSFDKDMLELTATENGLRKDHRLTTSEMDKLVQKTAKRKVVQG